MKKSSFEEFEENEIIVKKILDYFKNCKPTFFIAEKRIIDEKQTIAFGHLTDFNLGLFVIDDPGMFFAAFIIVMGGYHFFMENEKYTYCIVNLPLKNDDTDFEFYQKE